MKYESDLRIFSKKLKDLMLEKGLINQQGKPDRNALYNLMYPDTITEDDKKDKLAVESRTKTVGNWLNGKNYPKRIDDMLDLCNALNCDLDYFFTYMPEPTHDLKFIADSTELSWQAVQALQNLSEFEKLILNTMLKNGYFGDICFAVYSYMQTYYKELVVQDKDTGNTKLQDTEKMEIAEYRATKHFSNLLVNKLANDEDIKNYNDYEHDMEILTHVLTNPKVQPALKEASEKFKEFRKNGGSFSEFRQGIQTKSKINNNKGDD